MLRRVMMAASSAPPSGTEHVGITWAQSSAYQTDTRATATNMRDDANYTAAATNNGTTEWIRADLGSSKQVAKVDVGGGFISSGGWGDISPYLNGAVIQRAESTSGPWTTVATVSGVTDATNWRRSFNFAPASARYWRLMMPGWLSTSEFRLYT